MDTQAPWAARLTHSIATEIRGYRKARKVSAQDLAERCAKLGADVSRSTIADLENGRRAVISVPELLVIARALDVPPLLLVFPVGTAEDAEVLPGERRPPFRAAQWFTGEGPFPDPGDDALLTILAPGNSGAAAPVVLYRAADRLAEDELRAVTRADHYDERATLATTPDAREGFTAAAESQRSIASAARDEAGRLRQEAEARGLRPPAPVTRYRIPRAGMDGEQDELKAPATGRTAR